MGLMPQVVLVLGHQRLEVDLLTQFLKEDFSSGGAILDDGNDWKVSTAHYNPSVIIGEVATCVERNSHLLNELREMWPSAKVIVLTTKADVQATPEILSLEVNGHISKSSTGQQLIHAIHQVLHHRRYQSPD